MTYPQLINRFWDADRESPFTPCETRLYMLLLDAANRKGWPEGITLGMDETARLVGVTVPTFLRARARLAQAGLITCAEGGGRSRKACYSITDAPAKYTKNSKTNSKKNDIVSAVNSKKTGTVYFRVSELNSKTNSKTILDSTPIDIDLSSYKTDKDYIVEEKENYSKEKIPHGISAFAPEEEISDVVAQLKDEGVWGESVCMKFRLSPDSLTDLLDEYRLHCMTIGEERKTVKDAKRHFTNWLRAKARSEKTDRHETDRNDNRSAGRDERDAAFRSYVINKLSNGDGG